MISYLEMHSPESLLAKEAARGLEVRECRIPQYQFNRFLYHYVGAPWGWSDKLSWTDARWQDYVETPRLRTWIGYLEGSPAGYFELQQQEEGNVEIAYFGLVERFMGMGFGGYLLTQAIRAAWSWEGTRRVWVHTCTQDHPNALKNYQARGMQLYRTEA